MTFLKSAMMQEAICSDHGYFRRVTAEREATAECPRCHAVCELRFIAPIATSRELPFTEQTGALLRELNLGECTMTGTKIDPKRNFANAQKRMKKRVGV